MTKRRTSPPTLTGSENFHARDTGKRVRMSIHSQKRENHSKTQAQLVVVSLHQIQRTFSEDGYSNTTFKTHAGSFSISEN